MYGSPAMSKDLNLPFPASPFRQGNEDSDLRRAQKEQEMSSGLLRYRTASGSAFAEEFAPNKSSSPEAVAESMFARFMGPGQVGGEKRSEEVAAAPHMFFQTSFQQQIPVSAGESGGSSGLVPRSSSPAGLFSHLNVENAGFSGIRSMGGFQSAAAGTSDAETGKRLKGRISFSSRQGSAGLSQISEIGNEDINGTNRDKNPAAASAGARCYIPGFPVASWEDSVLMSESFAGEKAVRDPSESQNMEMRNDGPTMAHHYSLPKSSAEMVAMERFLQFQDAVPCKIRAKRGCATHPRSIAERVRRTRISERMRKLQELVPNMDKQTNTADMLDLAVDYIKDLHRQSKMLQDNRANCSCSHKQTNNP